MRCVDEKTALDRSPDGVRHPAWRLESKRQGRRRDFPRSSRSSCKDNFVVVQADVYNRRDEKQKVYAVTRLQQIQGIWTVDGLDHDQRYRPDAHRARRRRDRYNIGLKEDDFSRRELERPGAVSASARRRFLYRWRYRRSRS